MEQLDELNRKVEESTNPKQTFLEYLDLWTDFYNNRHTLIQKYILDNRLYTIIQFLLENENGEIFEYFHDNLIETLNKAQGQFCFTLRNHKPKQREDIDALITLLKSHDELCVCLANQEQEDIFGSIKKYQSDDLELNIIDALIVSIYDQFFQLDETIVKKTIEQISKSKTLFKIEPTKKITMYNDLIFQYIEKLIPIKEFIQEDLKEDGLIKKIVSQEVKNKKLLLKLINTISIETLMSIFHQDLKEFITFLETIDYLDEAEKYSLLSKIANQLLEEDNFCYLFALIANNYQSNLWQKYLTKDIYQKILSYATSTIPVNLNEEMIEYILEKDADTTDFIINISHLTSPSNKNLPVSLNLDRERIKKQLDEKITKKYDSIEKINQVLIKKEDSLDLKTKKSILYDMRGEIIDFETAIELLSAYFENKIELTKRTTQPIIRSIIINMLKSMDISLNGVYFYESSESNGVYYDDKINLIGITNHRIEEFLNKKASFYDRLQLFATSFHEMKHGKQNYDKQNGVWDSETYEIQKEDILSEYDSKFYRTNYPKMKSEIDARVEGYDMLSKFIETFFPNLLDTIQTKLISDLEKEQVYQQNHPNTKEMTFFGNLTTICNYAFDNFIRYNPDILKEFPIFSLEYHTNGLPKTPEEILLQKNEKNQELIESILNNRININSLSKEEQLSNFSRK